MEKQLLRKVSNSDFKAFAKEAMKKKGFYRSLFLIFMGIFGLGFCICLGYCFALYLLGEKNNYLLQLGLAVAFCFFFLVILHELLHGLGYKLVGAKKVYFGAIFSQFVFYAGCDQQKFTGVQYRFVAMLPFAIFTVFGVLTLILYPEYFMFTLSVLAFHTLCCSGDFAVLNFLYRHDLKQVYTFDSHEKQETYFYKTAGIKER